MRRRRRLAFTLAAVTLCLSPLLAPPARAEKLDDKSREAVDRGLKWLSTRWEAGPPPEALADRTKANLTAIPSLTGLALLAADGAKPGEGPYGVATKQCLDTVLASR